MKKILFGIMLLLFGCFSSPMRGQYAIGMRIDDFQTHNKFLIVYRMSADTTIYIRKEEHIEFLGLVENYSMYYYVFVGGKLVLVQRGEEDDEPPLKPIME